MQFLRQLIDALLYPLRALLTSPGKLSSGARRLVSISLPARISLLVALMLIFAAIAAYFDFHSNPESRSYWKENQYTIAIIGAAIPIVLYFVLKLWLEGDVSRYPEIDRAWKAGLTDLRAQGLDLRYSPLFLVIGSPGELQEKSILGATQLPFRVREVPTGDAWLHWYAEPDGIYLVCTKVGCLSALATEAKRIFDEQRNRGGAAARTIPPKARAKAAPDPRMTVGLDTGGESEGPTTATATIEPAEPAAAPDVKGTAMPKSPLVSQLFPAEPRSAPPATADIRGTIRINTGDDDPVMVQHQPQHLNLPQDVLNDHERRLEYLCTLIVKERQPLAPLNGSMALLPFNVVQTGRREGTQLQQAVKRDVNTLVRMLKLRCPVTGLVVGMEEESGFRELIRRLGRDTTAEQRFGKGFSVGNPPIPEQLEAVATHACGLFEAKVYELFREKGALSKPGNRKLYALLCKVRRTVRTPLTNVLANGFAHDPDAKQDDVVEPLLFSGCYFAATGEGEGRQAFIKGVFSKLPEQQEELEWTPSALDDDDWYHRWSQGLLLVDGALLVSLVLMIGYKYWAG